MTERPPIDLGNYREQKHQVQKEAWLKKQREAWEDPDFREVLRGLYGISEKATFEEFLRAKREFIKDKPGLKNLPGNQFLYD